MHSFSGWPFDFLLPGNSLGPINQAGGSKFSLRSALHRRDGCPEGFRAPGKPSLGMVFSEKRAGRPRTQAGPLARVLGARSARKLIQWIKILAFGQRKRTARAGRKAPDRVGPNVSFPTLFSPFVSWFLKRKSYLIIHYGSRNICLSRFHAFAPTFCHT